MRSRGSEPAAARRSAHCRCRIASVVSPCLLVLLSVARILSHAAARPSQSEQAERKQKRGPRLGDRSENKVLDTLARAAAIEHRAGNGHVGDNSHKQPRAAGIVFKAAEQTHALVEYAQRRVTAEMRPDGVGRREEVRGDPCVLAARNGYNQTKTLISLPPIIRFPNGAEK